MRLKCILCKVLQREAYWCAARSPHIIDIVLMPQGLHNTPDILRAEVQKEADKILDAAGNLYDAILLGYGLCSNGVAGISCKTEMIIPRAHDCITLLLGSRHLYQEYFDSHRGTYWYSVGWLENSPMPGPERLNALKAEYTEKYGADNAEFLMETEQGWMKEYQWATFVDWGLPGTDAQKKYTRNCASHLNWQYDEVIGSSGLMQRFFDGQWNQDEFLHVQPGQIIRQDISGTGIISAEPAE